MAADGLLTLPADWITDRTTIVALAAVVATLVAGLVTAVGTALAPPLGLLLRRLVDRRRSRRILIDEVQDIIRHCHANREILAEILRKPGLPAQMHIEKMRMFETMLIFDNTLAFDIPSQVRRRFIGLRLVVRNLDIEIDDTVRFLYGDGRPSDAEIVEQLTYLDNKLVYAEVRLQQELHALDSLPGPAPFASRPKTIVYRKLRATRKRPGERSK